MLIPNTVSADYQYYTTTRATILRLQSLTDVFALRVPAAVTCHEYCDGVWPVAQGGGAMEQARSPLNTLVQSGKARRKSIVIPVLIYLR